MPATEAGSKPYWRRYLQDLEDEQRAARKSVSPLQVRIDSIEGMAPLLPSCFDSMTTPCSWAGFGGRASARNLQCESVFSQEGRWHSPLFCFPASMFGSSRKSMPVTLVPRQAKYRAFPPVPQSASRVGAGNPVGHVEERLLRSADVPGACPA